MNNVYLIIPSLEPKEEFVGIVKELKKTFKNIIIINDGSNSSYDHIFDAIKKEEVIYLKHDINYGKGKALKTAFNYLLDKKIDFDCVVTADSDGQHLPKDIRRVADETIKHQDYLVLGSRNFDNPDMPKKNRFGNRLTSIMFKLFVGIKIKDTQTGLRGLSKKLVNLFLFTKGERFEYETNMLIDCKEKDIPIKEITITSVYSKDDYSTHFNPFKDSIRIYKLFFKYLISAGSSFVIDLGLFSLFKPMLDIKYSVILATIMARVISSSYNYMVNSKLVFKKKDKKSVIKYYILVAIQMCVSAVCVYFIDNELKMNTSLIKLFVDTIIFIVNFVVQREWVFNNCKKK